MPIKKIYLLCTSDLFYDQRLNRIIDTLSKHEFEVISFSRKISGKKVLQLNTINFQLKTFFSSSWLFYAEYNIRLFFLLFFKKVKYIYSVDADTLLASTLIKKLKRCKLIYDAHEYFEHSPEITNKKYIQRFWNKITKWGVNVSDLCITVGPSLAEVLSHNFNRKFYSIRNVPDQAPNNHIQYPSSKKIIWYQGVLNIGRGLEEMIYAMQRLEEYELHLAGEGDISEELKKITEKLNLGHRVIFHGKLTARELRQHNQQAFIGINLLSNQSLNYYYSLANRTFDYIYAQLPAIHMSFPEYKLIFNEFEVGILIDTLDETNILSAIKKFENNDFYLHCKNQCVLAMKRYSWESEAKILVGLMNKL